jgi:hypothetical protein
MPKLIASNSEEETTKTLKDAFSYHASNPKDVPTTINKLVKPLKGVGPATASLLLARHDPLEIVFFSDELFSWLVNNGQKVSPKYNVKEFTELYDSAKVVMNRIKCTPIELEKVAFVLIREAKPVRESAPKSIPSGGPKGRHAMTEGQKKAYIPSGRPRGRPAAVKPANVTSEPSKKRRRPTESPTSVAASSTPKKRGRPNKSPVLPDSED